LKGGLNSYSGKLLAHRSIFNLEGEASFEVESD